MIFTNQILATDDSYPETIELPEEYKLPQEAPEVVCEEEEEEEEEAPNLAGLCTVDEASGSSATEQGSEKGKDGKPAKNAGPGRKSGNYIHTARRVHSLLIRGTFKGPAYVI